MTSPATAILRSETRLFLREPGALFWIMAFPTVLLVILGLIPSFTEASDDLGGLRVVDLYVPVSILLAAIVAGVQVMPVVMATYRERQILRRVATTPARPWHLLGAQYVLHGAAVAIAGLLVLLIGRFAFDVSLPGSLPAYLLVLVLALLSCLVIGGVISGLAPSSKTSATIGTLVFFPMMFTAGVYLPVQTMPGLLGRIVELTPLGAAARGLDQAALGEWPDARYILVPLVWTLGLGALAARYFRWE